MRHSNTIQPVPDHPREWTSPSELHREACPGQRGGANVGGRTKTPSPRPHNHRRRRRRVDTRPRQKVVRGISRWGAVRCGRRLKIIGQETMQYVNVRRIKSSNIRWFITLGGGGLKVTRPALPSTRPWCLRPFCTETAGDQQR